MFPRYAFVMHACVCMCLCVVLYLKRHTDCTLNLLLLSFLWDLAHYLPFRKWNRFGLVRLWLTLTRFFFSVPFLPSTLVVLSCACVEKGKGAEGENLMFIQQPGKKKKYFAVAVSRHGLLNMCMFSWLWLIYFNYTSRTSLQISFCLHHSLG